MSENLGLLQYSYIITDFCSQFQQGFTGNMDSHDLPKFMYKHLLGLGSIMFNKHTAKVLINAPAFIRIITFYREWGGRLEARVLT